MEVWVNESLVVGQTRGDRIGYAPSPVTLVTFDDSGLVVLVLEDLKKAYGEVVALDGCRLRVRPGRIVGFLGPNGAGKTSAMRAVFGLLRLDGGQVLWDHVPVTREQRLRFGYMPEVRGLYPRMKVRDQIVYLGRLHNLDKQAALSVADRWLAKVGLEDRAGARLEELSHGNQQRVQLVAALVHNPELLVLDEPFSGLDPLGVEEMADILRRRAASGTAVLFSSHQLDLVEDLCDDVAIINRGRVVLKGDVDSLKDRSRYRRLDVDTPASIRTISRMKGVRTVRSQGSRHAFLVPAEVDLEELVAQLPEQAPVREFSYRPPTLSDLFMEAVGP